MALVQTPPGEQGFPCPEFELPLAKGGVVHSLSLISKENPFLIVFICNHCPYVKAIESRLVALSYILEKLDIPLLAISSNDSSRYPEDSFEKMKEKNYPFMYGYDEEQKIAKLFGAVCTPDFFLFDKDNTLAYRGRLDNNWKDPGGVTRQELLEVVLQLYLGEHPLTEPEKPSMGCSIKWKE